jgi:UDP-2,3-diacylglucosamine pyrophosphatase LpxH
VSRRYSEPREVILPKLARDIARPALARGHDAVVIGHVHEPAHLRMDGGEFLVIGDWLENFTYVVLEEGRFRLHRHQRGGGLGRDPEIASEEIDRAG